MKAMIRLIKWVVMIWIRFWETVNERIFGLNKYINEAADKKYHEQEEAVAELNHPRPIFEKQKEIQFSKKELSYISYEKQIWRLIAIQRRTNKLRVKKKLMKRIIGLYCELKKL